MNSPAAASILIGENNAFTAAVTPNNETSNSTVLIMGIEQVSAQQLAMPTIVAPKAGREKNVQNYTAGEHVLLCNEVSNHPGAFEASATSELFLDIEKNMKAKMNPGYNRSGVTLHAHFSEMAKFAKSAMKDYSFTGDVQRPTAASIASKLSLLGTGPRSTEKAYYNAVLVLMQSSASNKYGPKAWWNVQVVELIVDLIIASQANAGLATPQTANTIAAAAIKEKGKFAQDVANREEMIRKRKADDKLEKEEKEKKMTRMLENDDKRTAAFDNFVSAFQLNQQGNTGENVRLDKVEAEIAGLKTDLKDGFAAILARLPPPA